MGFQKGNKLGGRHKIDVDLKRLARSFGDAAFQVLVNLLESEDEKVRLGAAKEILDRGYGKPVQQISGEDGAPLHAVLQIIQK